jgi:hypothetical protein
MGLMVLLIRAQRCNYKWQEAPNMAIYAKVNVGAAFLE